MFLATVFLATGSLASDSLDTVSLGDATLGAAREVQIPIIALLLIGACAAKARRVARARSLDAATSPTGMFPVRLRRSTTLALCASELGLGAGLVVTAGQAGTPAVIVRAGTALLFAIAVAALNEMRTRRPDVGCGCFGDLSDSPVTMRSLARSALLCGGAVASIGVRPLRMPSASGALLLLAAGLAELLLLAALSPEVSEIMVRLGYSEPCEARRLPLSRTLAALRGSGAWRYYRQYLTSAVPADVWREGCWRFAAYPAVIDDRAVDVVFAVFLKDRRPPVRAAVVDAESVSFGGAAPRTPLNDIAMTEPLARAGRVRPYAPAAVPQLVPHQRLVSSPSLETPLPVPAPPALVHPLAQVALRASPRFTPRSESSAGI